MDSWCAKFKDLHRSGFQDYLIQKDSLQLWSRKFVEAQDSEPNETIEKADGRVDRPIQPTQEGVNVQGFSLEGVGWDKKQNRLCESRKVIDMILLFMVILFLPRLKVLKFNFLF